jgi:DnaJ-class molecular chaperone
MNNSTTETEEEEPEECRACDGYGELPGNPNTNDFPTCHACNGTGLNQE